MTLTARRRLAFASILYTGSLIVLGVWVHTLGIRGAIDHFVERGELLLQGRLAGDPYHPFLYPELIALTTLVIGDAFAAARIVSSVAAGIFVYAATRLASDLWGERVAFWTFMLLVANGTVALVGIGGGADMTAAALWAISVWLVLREGRRSHALLAGLSFGLACATRLNCMLMLPVMGGSLFFVSAATKHERWSALRRFGLGLLIGYLPNGIPSWFLWGTPVTMENWRNLALKLAPVWDESLLEANAYSSMASLLRESWLPLLARTGQDLVTMAKHSWPQTLAGEGASPTLRNASGLAVGISWLLVLMIRRRVALPSLTVTLIWSLAIAATFFPQERLLMPVLPLALSALPAAAALMPRSRIIDATLGLFVVACAAAIPEAVRKFQAEQPHAEVAAARQLAAEIGPFATIASHYGLMARYVPARSVYVPEPPRSSDVATHFVRNVLKLAEAQPIDAVVVGPATMPSLSFAALQAACPPGSRVERCGEAIVLRLPPSHVWLDRATATRSATGIDLAIEVLRDDVLFAGFLVHQAGADPVPVLLPRTGPRTFAATIPLDDRVRGTIAVTPACMVKAGHLVRAAALHVELP